MNTAIFYLVIIILLVLLFLLSIKQRKFKKEISKLNTKLQIERYEFENNNIKILKANDKLKKEQKEIERAYAAKSEFLDIASHQLRTPVSLIIGTLDMLHEKNIENLPQEKRHEMIDHACEKARKLNNVVTDILSATEMDSPSFNVKDISSPVDLREVCSTQVKSFEEEAKARGLELTYTSPKNLPKVEGAEQFLSQAVNNMLSNALKYTKNGSVTLKIYRSKSNVKVEVIDTGIGVPEEDFSKLWQKFSRAKNARSMYTDGSGLGLFIIKRIIEGHRGGQVYFKSSLNSGSTFGFSLPILKKR